LLPAPCAAAEDADELTHEAARHFQHAVALYTEGDYRAALVEFQRAYTIVPNATVLYNIGETHYQLQDYAAALTTFERYLGEAGPTESHREAVERELDVLRARVGYLDVATTPEGAEVSVDEQPIGRTPLAAPVLVSIGRRRVLASLPGGASVARYVDVAVGDAVTLQLVVPPPPGGGTPPEGLPLPPAAAAAVTPSHPGGAGLRLVGWIGAGALASASATFAVLATQESSDLRQSRSAYPVASTTLTHEAGLTTTYSILADALGLSALVIGGVTLVATFASRGPGASAPSAKTGALRVVLSPASARITFSF
jgi:tetratricopeptide (TPR) repeat protein